MLLAIAIAVALLFLILASIQDLKKGEISDKISVGYAISIVILAIAYSLIQKNIDLFANTLLIGIGFFIIAYALFRLGQWGGGDVKMMFGLGGTLGLLNSLGQTWNTPIMPYYLAYFINMGIAALPYGILYMLILGFRKPEMHKKFKENLTKTSNLIILALSLTVFPGFYLLTAFPLFLIFSFIMPAFIIATIFLKTSEEVLLTRKIKVSQLKEEDALAEDLTFNGKKIASKRDIEGLSKEQLALIKKLASQKKIPSVIQIRWGVKFMPILTLAFLLTLYVGDLLTILMIEIVKNF